DPAPRRDGRAPGRDHEAVRRARRQARRAPGTVQGAHPRHQDDRAAPAEALRYVEFRPIEDRAFFARDARIVARALVGAYLVHGDRAARIVETEAYRGPSDLACHARAGLT